MADMRISGLASGMDTQQIISDLMRAERIPLDKTKQKKQLLQWKRDAYREMNTLMSKLRDETLNLRLQSTFLSKKTASTSEEKLTATASPRAGNVSYQISNATLATAAYNSSKLVDIDGNGLINGNEKISNTTTGKLNQSKKLWEVFRDGDFTNNFTWDTKVTDTVNVFQEGKNFHLSRQNIKTDSLSSGIDLNGGESDKIKVTSADGNSVKDYAVVYDATVRLTTDQVYVNKETGQMTFGENLSKDSKIEVNYSSYKEDLISVSSSNEGKVFQLSTPGLIIDNNNFADIKDNQAIIKTTRTIDGESVTEETIYTQVNNKNLLIEGQNTFFVDENGELTFSNNISKDSSISLNYTHKVVNTAISTFNEDGKEMKQSFSFDGSESLNDFFYKINTSMIGVNVYYDEFTDVLSVSRKETGNFNNDLNKIGGKEMGFYGDFFTDAFKIDTINEDGGTNAEFEINGLKTFRHSNTFTINDFTFTLKENIGTTPVTVTSKNDTDKVFESIKSFVELYNETIAKISEKLKEEKHRDYLPLTDEQKESLSEKEIEKWENLAKSGSIRNDPILRSVLNQMRIDFYSTVGNNTGEYSQLSNIGITTSNNYLDGGKLVINEDKLKKAIETDPESVFNLFGADGDTYNEKGISRRLRDTLTSTIERITSTAGNEMRTNSQFAIGRELTEIEDRINNFDRILKQKEDRYWKQYTAMERAMQQSNEQMNYLMQQLGAWSAQ
ncbi:flagellar filament capping protein FliD [Bacillus sp. Marseille-P3661]|uniref:flagellar filament capping protein FliD n=1 Tax=Bacillus sp. Marseille-P3661 TaxID=1936234 RepID=UPI000C83F188|nr:flagellar filament capping protein FliD [Bacillus sp. Marseille-P3661]